MSNTNETDSITIIIIVVVIIFLCLLLIIAGLIFALRQKNKNGVVEEEGEFIVKLKKNFIWFIVVLFIKTDFASAIDDDDSNSICKYI